MNSANPHPVRIGVPFRTLEEERAGEAKSKKIEYYYRSIHDAGADAVPISLAQDPAAIRWLAESLDAFVLPGSPADVDPARYRAARDPETHAPDPARESTDTTLLGHAFAAGKPVLAICYGTQHLNVYLGGTLVQDIGTEPGSHLQHEERNGVYPSHEVRLEAGSLLASLAGNALASMAGTALASLAGTAGLAQLAGAGEPRVNSSHHQSVRVAAPKLRVTAHAPDGIIEAVEWTGDSNWIVGVQWHPERMEGDPFAAALFRELVAAARHAAVEK